MRQCHTPVLCMLLLISCAVPPYWLDTSSWGNADALTAVPFQIDMQARDAKLLCSRIIA